MCYSIYKFVKWEVAETASVPFLHLCSWNKQAEALENEGETYQGRDLLELKNSGLVWAWPHGMGYLHEYRIYMYIHESNQSNIIKLFGAIKIILARRGLVATI